LEDIETTARNVLRLLNIAGFVRTITIEEAESPWSERSYIRRKKGQLDVKIIVWADEPFLYGRIYRLFLYIYDVLTPEFGYEPKNAPVEETEPVERDRYNQIWSIYVDSRMEKLGIPNFYDRILRRNIFMDMEKNLPWSESAMIFETLWRKDHYHYQEIVDYAYSIGKQCHIEGGYGAEALEVEVNACLAESSVRQHLQRIQSDTFRTAVNDLLSFAAYNCKDGHIEASHYGININYQRRLFAELIPTGEDTLFVTLFDSNLQSYKTYLLEKEADVPGIQQTIKECYSRLTMHSQL
jgi:hypothetical protein